MSTTTAPVTRATILAGQEKDIRTYWFPEHVAESEEHGPYRRIVWKKPGTSTYRVDYTTYGRYLMVTGDCCEAAYEWGVSLTWEFLGGCALGYFMSKQEASSGGSRHKDWDEQVARQRIKEAFADQEEAGYDHYKGLEEWRAERVDLSSRSSLHAWIHQGTYGEYFGWDATEWLGSAGDIYSIHHVAHWLGLRLALGQLGIAPPPEFPHE